MKKGVDRLDLNLKESTAPLPHPTVPIKEKHRYTYIQEGSTIICLLALLVVLAVACVVIESIRLAKET